MEMVDISESRSREVDRQRAKLYAHLSFFNELELAFWYKQIIRR